MAIKLRDDTKIPKKVMFIGKDGSGKSTNAVKYCEAKHLKPKFQMFPKQISQGYLEVFCLNH